MYGGETMYWDKGINKHKIKMNYFLPVKTDNDIICRTGAMKIKE